MSQPLASSQQDAGDSTWKAVVVGALVMGMGWGIHGAYGNNTGALLPGALFGLAIAVCSGREDWYRRAAVIGMVGALAWGMAGLSRHGLRLGETLDPTPSNSFAGYAALFLVGGIWGGLGGGIFGLALTQSRSLLNQIILPLLSIQVLWYTLKWTGINGLGDALVGENSWLSGSGWLQALAAFVVAIICFASAPRLRPACWLILILCAGWWIGMIVLPGLLGLRLEPRIDPDGNDAWAGLLGVLAALVVYLFVSGNRAARMLVYYGLIAGALGLVLGGFVQMMGRAGWGPIGKMEILHGANSFIVMQMVFGTVAGLGVALGVRRLIQNGLQPPAEDVSGDWLTEFALFVIVCHVMWVNFSSDIDRWIFAARKLPQTIYGYATQSLFTVIAVMMAGMFVYMMYRRRTTPLALLPASPLGQAQMLFLTVLWMTLAGYLAGTVTHGPTLVACFMITGAVSSIVLTLPATAEPVGSQAPRTASDSIWRLDRRYPAMWLAALGLTLVASWQTRHLGLLSAEEAARLKRVKIEREIQVREDYQKPAKFEKQNNVRAKKTPRRAVAP